MTVKLFLRTDDEVVKMEGFHKLHDDLEKVIEKEDSNSSVTTDSDEAKHEFRTFRERVIHLIHTNKFQIGVICLVFLDCLLVISELLLDLQVLQVHNYEKIVVAFILHYASLAILGIFLLEIAVRLYALRLDFFRHKMEMFDAVVVIVSFVLDIVFRQQKGPENGVGLLIILRLWRVTRILNGIIMSVKKQADKKLQRERRLREACEQELSKFREYCSAQESEIELLQGLLRKHGITDAEKHDQPPPASIIAVVAEVNTVDQQTIKNCCGGGGGGGIGVASGNINVANNTHNNTILPNTPANNNNNNSNNNNTNNAGTNTNITIGGMVPPDNTRSPSRTALTMNPAVILATTTPPTTVSAPITTNTSTIPTVTIVEKSSKTNQDQGS